MLRSVFVLFFYISHNILTIIGYRDYMSKKIISFFVILSVAISTCVTTIMINDEPASQSIQTEKYYETQEDSDDSAGESETGGTAEIQVDSKSAILLEASSGRVIYEKDAYNEMAPASITKIMTLLLIFDAIDAGKITLDDQVSVSEHAASMGGSQVYLEVNETQTVNDMIKCISIASANDACVAMAEYVAGSEEAFVNMMNDKAASLGMENTHFVNSCGLDVEGHYSCAADIATMGRELITKYPQISEYATTWMDTITHKTKKGETEFGLTNTNKLVRTYEGITGLKTGSTDDAGYCLCATSTRNGVSMVAVVMSAKDHKSRFSECAALMDYGYGKCSLYTDTKDYSDDLDSIEVEGYIDKYISAGKGEFSTVLIGDESGDNIDAAVHIDKLTAPVNKGDTIGYVEYKMNGTSIGKVDITASKDAPKSTYSDYLKFVFNRWLGNK